MTKNKIMLPILVTTWIVTALWVIVFAIASTRNKSVKELSPWQLLDAQLKLEKQIDIMTYNKNQLKELRDSKVASIRGQDITGAIPTAEEIISPVLEKK